MVARAGAERMDSDSYTVVDGPLGPLFMAFGDGGLTSVAPTAFLDRARFERQYERRLGRRLRPAEVPPAGLPAALGAGSAVDVPVDVGSLSPFARAVLDVTAGIPIGQVRTYAWVARQLGRPRAVRAVGSALARNPIPVVIPCHRVVRSDGRLGEYAFGTAFKRALLEREGVDVVGSDRLAGAARDELEPAR